MDQYEDVSQRYEASRGTDETALRDLLNVVAARTS